MLFLMLLVSTFLFADTTQTEVDELCKSAIAVVFPEQDKPTEQDKKALTGCDPMEFYYGGGSSETRCPLYGDSYEVDQDYVRARKTALLDEGEMYDLDKAVLIMLYANGYGVQKNIDLAIALTCQLKVKPEEIKNRIEHLKALKNNKLNSMTNFDFFDDTLDRGFVANYYSSGIYGPIDNRLNELTKDWSKKANKKYVALAEAASNYFQLNAAYETQHAGHANDHTAEWQEAWLNAGLFLSIVKFEKQRFSIFTHEDFLKSDKEMNELYKELIKKLIQANKKEAYYVKFYSATVDKGLKESEEYTQKAWLAYRNAWVKFAAVRYPAMSADSVKTWLTKKRIKDQQENLEMLYCWDDDETCPWQEF